MAEVKAGEGRTTSGVCVGNSGRPAADMHATGLYRRSETIQSRSVHQGTGPPIASLTQEDFQAINIAGH